MTEPAITPELVAKHNLTPDGRAVFNSGRLPSEIFATVSRKFGSIEIVQTASGQFEPFINCQTPSDKSLISTWFQPGVSHAKRRLPVFVRPNTGLTCIFHNPRHPGHVAQTSKSAVSRVSKPADATLHPTFCRLGSRRHSRLGSLRYARLHWSKCEISRLKPGASENLFAERTRLRMVSCRPILQTPSAIFGIYATPSRKSGAMEILPTVSAFFALAGLSFCQHRILT